MTNLLLCKYCIYNSKTQQENLNYYSPKVLVLTNNLPAVHVGTASTSLGWWSRKDVPPCFPSEFSDRHRRLKVFTVLQSAFPPWASLRTALQLMGDIWPNRWSWHAVDSSAVSQSLRWIFVCWFVFFRNLASFFWFRSQISFPSQGWVASMWAKC